VQHHSHRFARFAEVAALSVVALVSLSDYQRALAAFGAPFYVSGSASGHALTYGTPRVAVDVDGDALFAWIRNWDGGDNRIQARFRAKDGVLGPIYTLSAAGAHAWSPQVAMNARGDALVVWERSNQIEMRARSAGGTFGPVQVVGGGRVPLVAIASNGDALIVWHVIDTSYRIFARSRSASGALGPIQTVAADRSDQAHLAMNARGDFVIAWGYRASYPVSQTLIQARAGSVSGMLGPVRTLTPALPNSGSGASSAGNPQVAIDADGDSIVVWDRWHVPVGANLVQARARSKTGALSAIQTLSPLTGSANDQRVAMNALGNAVVVWHYFGPSTISLQMRARTAAGVLSPIQVFSPVGGEPQVAVSGSGRALALWDANGVMKARTRSATGVLGPLLTLTLDDDLRHVAEGPALAMSPAGKALLTWVYGLGLYGFERIQARTGP
jgi:hypothetical protein